MGKKNKEKFQFGLDFQESILQYIVTDPKGYKVLQLLDDTYFTSITHSVIAYAIKKYQKKRKRIPEETFLREFLRSLYAGDSKVFNELLPKDKDTIDSLLTKLYYKPVSDPDLILDKVINFAKFVKFKEELEKTDVDNYESYENSIKGFNNIQRIGMDLKEDYGTFVVAGMPERAHRRDLDTVGHPTPFWQINKTFNSGGTTTGNLIVVISEEKRFKTGFFINLAKYYMRRKKKVVIFDLENGERALQVRTEQSVLNKAQSEIISGEWDDKLLKVFRKYKRLGAELVIKRFPALSTTTDDFQTFLDKLKDEKGFVANACIVDYGMLMAARSGKKDEFERISDSFLDLKNFAEYNKFDALYSAAHVTRDGVKRKGSKYKATDIAKCIDIPRHLDALWGIQESEEEIAAGIMRLEVIEQRNGPQDGRALFWLDIKNQSIKEFTKGELKEYMDQVGDGDAPWGKERETEVKEERKKNRKTDL